MTPAATGRFPLRQGLLLGVSGLLALLLLDFVIDRSHGQMAVSQRILDSTRSADREHGVDSIQVVTALNTIQQVVDWSRQMWKRKLAREIKQELETGIPSPSYYYPASPRARDSLLLTLESPEYIRFGRGWDNLDQSGRMTALQNHHYVEHVPAITEQLLDDEMIRYRRTAKGDTLLKRLREGAGTSTGDDWIDTIEGSD